MNNYGYIYKCIDTRTSKIYIGASTKLDHINDYLGSGRHWIKEVDPYNNKDLIKKEILEYVDSQDALYDREEYWIAFYDATNPKIGYNKAKGGRHAFVVSEEAKKIRDQHDSETMKELMKDPNRRKQISESLKKYKKEHGVSEEHRKHLSEALKGRNVGCNGDTRSIGVYCIINKQIYEFHNKITAARWWFDNYPFSKNYAEITYTRAITKSINGDKITYKSKPILDKINWYLTLNKNELIYCIVNNKDIYEFKNKIQAANWWYCSYRYSIDYNQLGYINKITKSINSNKPSVFLHSNKKTSIQWFKKGSENN